MNITGKAMLAIVAMFLAALTQSCASTAPKESALLGAYARNLGPGPEGGAKLRWIKPGVDLSKYNKLMVDSVLFYFAEDSESKAIDPEKMKELSDLFNQEFVQTLRDKNVSIVGEPGPGVARIRTAITDLKLNNQAMSAISTVTSLTPIGLGLNLVKRGATGTWAGSGMTKAEFMVLDAATGDVIAVAADERAAGFTERYTEMGSVKAAFQFWAERVVKFIEDVRGRKP